MQVCEAAVGGRGAAGGGRGGTPVLTNEERSSAAAACWAPRRAAGAGVLLADCRGDDLGIRRRGGGRRRVKHLCSDSWWKCLFSRLDTDLTVIRSVLCSCPAGKAFSAEQP